MSDNIRYVRSITEKTIPELADKVFSGLLDEAFTFNTLFKKYIPLLEKELEKRRTEEIFWLDASNSHDIKKLSDYVETYDNEITEYRGRHIDEAKQLIELIENDDREWHIAKSESSFDSFKHYLDIYENPESLYKGKHSAHAQKEIKKIKDKEDWEKAKKENTIKSYSSYLSNYDKAAPEYSGLYVDEAKSKILFLEEETEWLHASNLNSVQGYKVYLAKYDVLPPTFKGHHIEEAKNRIASLMPPPPPDSRAEDESAWMDAVNVNSEEKYRHYLQNFSIHANEAELAIRQLIDDAAWKEAIGMKSIHAYEKYLSICKVNDYPGYNWLHINDAKAQIVNLRKAEKATRKEKERQRLIDEDNYAWENAKTANTMCGYRDYLDNFSKSNGLHVSEAKEAIIRLQEEEDWLNACKKNSLSAYKKFVDKYDKMSGRYKSCYLSQAKSQVQDLTPPNPHNPIKWWYWILLLIVFAICWSLWVQWKGGSWPFNGPASSGSITGNTKKIEVDSLQWAIEHHDIRLLTKYAELDSTKAYYPLALALNTQDSVKNVEKTLHWLDLVLDPDINSLHQNIINDIQKKELDELEERFSAINPNETDADKKYLEVYTDYVLHFEKLAVHIPRIRVQYMPIEEMANAQINDRKKYEELHTSILREWEAQQSRLKKILSKIDENAKKAYDK